MTRDPSWTCSRTSSSFAWRRSSARSRVVFMRSLRSSTLIGGDSQLTQIASAFVREPHGDSVAHLSTVTPPTNQPRRAEQPAAMTPAGSSAMLPAGGPQLVPWYSLVDDDPERRRAGGKCRWRGGQFGQIASPDDEAADCGAAAIDDPERRTVGAQAHVLGSQADRLLEQRAADQLQRSVVADKVMRDARDGGVDGEQNPAVVTYLDPAGRRLQVGERGRSDRGQAAVGGGAVGGHGPVVGPTMGVGDEQLGRIGRAELAPERTGALSRVRRPRRGGQPSGAADGEAVDLRGPHAGSDQLGAIAAEQGIAGLRAVRQRDRRSRDWPQSAVPAEPEAGVVAAAEAGVGHIHEAVMKRDADGLSAP